MKGVLIDVFKKKRKCAHQYTRRQNPDEEREHRENNAASFVTNECEHLRG